MSGDPVRQVTLPGNRVLTIRHETGEDAAALIGLYDRLGPEELYYRFFAAHRPPEPFIRRMAQVSDRGGAGLVAVVTGPGEPGRIVGEASCEPLPGGDAELGIAVERAFRGWLGPYLLDALIDEARRLGVHNLQAEVLATNRRMLALLRSRGLVTLERSDGPATVRVAIGINSATPLWPARTGAGRVLVELSAHRWQRADGSHARDLQIIGCPGPGHGGPACPALSGGPCPLAGDADLIVVFAGNDLPLARRLLAAHRRLHPLRPVYVAGGPPPGAGLDDAPALPPGEEAAVELLRSRIRSLPGRPGEDR